MEIVTLLVIEVYSSKSFLISSSTSAVAETRNPRKNMIAAMRTVFFRIFVCYVGPAYIVCLISLKLVV
jgi:amino acid transporter